jgi:hypothetical protein
MIRLPRWFVLVLALAFLVGLAVPVLAADTKGKIKSVAADKDEFVLTDKDGKDWTFHMDKNAKVRLGDKNITLKDLRPGEEATVSYDKEGTRLIAKEVRCEKK